MTKASFFLLLVPGLLLSACPSAPQPSPEKPKAQASEPQAKPPPPVEQFDFPVGPPDGKGYYNAQGFGKNSHLGDDWNGTGGGNSDLGDPVYATAKGRVTFAQDVRGGWGNVVRVLHNVGSTAQPSYVESLYGHLDTVLVDSGQLLARGEQLGSIGNAHGIYYAHLHFEIRDSIDMPIGPGYSEDTAGYRDPTLFIQHWKR